MTEPGLCAACVHGRRIQSARGSTFWLCRRSEGDPEYPRYPRLPVLVCAGYETQPRVRSLPSVDHE